jgi:hypothetical protein
MKKPIKIPEPRSRWAWMCCRELERLLPFPYPLISEPHPTIRAAHLLTRGGRTTTSESRRQLEVKGTQD